MIFKTNLQLNCFLIFLFFGIIIGFISNCYDLIFLKNYQKKLKKIVFDCIFYVFFSIFYVFLINYFNFGHYSIALILSYIFGFWIAKTLLRKTVVILQSKWYNKINILIKSKKIKKQRKTKKHETSNKN